MLKITEYGNQIMERFYEKCKKDGTYDKVFVDFEDGTCLLEPSVRDVKDCAALYLITYDRYALDTVEAWMDTDKDSIVFFGEDFSIHFGEIIKELKKCLASDNTYGCDMCGKRKDFDDEITWITSSYGMCQECYDKLSDEELEELRRIYE